MLLLASLESLSVVTCVPFVDSIHTVAGGHDAVSVAGVNVVTCVPSVDCIPNVAGGHAAVSVPGFTVASCFPASLLLLVFRITGTLRLSVTCVRAVVSFPAAAGILLTEKGADIMCYQITMRTCTVAIYQTPRFKMPSPEAGGAN
jgi:hypothetical protein